VPLQPPCPCDSLPKVGQRPRDSFQSGPEAASVILNPKSHATLNRAGDPSISQDSEEVLEFEAKQFRQVEVQTEASSSASGEVALHPAEDGRRAETRGGGAEHANRYLTAGES
jgi:hypothetical protein